MRTNDWGGVEQKLLDHNRCWNLEEWETTRGFSRSEWWQSFSWLIISGQRILGIVRNWWRLRGRLRGRWGWGVITNKKSICCSHLTLLYRRSWNKNKNKEFQPRWYRYQRREREIAYQSVWFDFRQWCAPSCRSRERDEQMSATHFLPAFIPFFFAGKRNLSSFIMIHSHIISWKFLISISIGCWLLHNSY